MRIRYFITSIIFALFSCLITTATQAKDLADYQYAGYRVVHHLGVQIDHMNRIGFNTFEHPPISDHRSFVITPALDHFYSKAVVDVRWGPVVIDVPAKDNRYSSIEIFCQEHFAIYDKITGHDGERFVLIHEDYKGPLPKGTVVKTKSNFPFVFMRTQSFSFNNDKKADAIRRQARISGVWQKVSLPNPKDPTAVIKWSVANSKPYPQTKNLMKKASANYTAAAIKKPLSTSRLSSPLAGLAAMSGCLKRSMTQPEAPIKYAQPVLF